MYLKFLKLKRPPSCAAQEAKEAIEISSKVSLGYDKLENLKREMKAQISDWTVRNEASKKKTIANESGRDSEKETDSVSERRATPAASPCWSDR